jgi:hypothetical protein
MFKDRWIVFLRRYNLMFLSSVVYLLTGMLRIGEQVFIILSRTMTLCDVGDVIRRCTVRAWRSKESQTPLVRLDITYSLESGSLRGT